MKRIISTIAIIMAVVLLLASCGTQSEKIIQLSDLEGKVVATLSIPVPPEEFVEFIKVNFGIEANSLLYFDTLLGAIAALKKQPSRRRVFLRSYPWILCRKE
jgi:uncharacterized membrane protein